MRSDVRGGVGGCLRRGWVALGVGACLLAAGVGRGAEGDEAQPMGHFLKMTVQDGKLVSEVVGAAPATDPPVAGRLVVTREIVKIAGVEGDVSVIHRATGISLSSNNGRQTRSISITPAAISMVESSTAGGGVSRVTLQQRSAAAAGGNTVILNVIKQGMGGEAATNVQISEATFEELWRKHPEEMKTYVAPLFKAWGMPELFPVSLEEARALLAELKAAEALKDKDDGQIKGKVKELLARLGADNWKERDAARGELLRMGTPALPFLRELDVENMPVEAAEAVKAALNAQEDGRLNDPDFFLQLVGLDDAEVAAEGARRYEMMTGKKLGIDLSEPAKERAAAVAKMRAAQ